MMFALLAFITKRLFEENRDDEAKMWSELQTKDSLPAKRLTQMVFALGGTIRLRLSQNAQKQKSKAYCGSTRPSGCRPMQTS